MDIDEETGEGPLSSALVVDRQDLRNMSITLDDDDDDEEEGENNATVFHELRKYSSPTKLGSSPKKRRLPELHPISDTVEDNNAPIPSTSRDAARRLSTSSIVIDPEEEIRQATTQYLQGELSATEFAAAMEEFERFKAQQEAEERGPSLVLLNPEQIEHVPEVILTEEVVDEEEDKEATKLRGEFFRTGDDITTFTIRKKKKMPPTIKNMMGEAHVRFARGDLSGAESICLEVIKERKQINNLFVLIECTKFLFF
jgi:hypothetical protein